MSGGIVWRRPRGVQSSPQGGEGDQLLVRAWNDYDFDRAIWLPVPPEPVILMSDSGVRLPGRVLSRSADSLEIAIVVPLVSLMPRDLAGLVVEYSNACGRVRLTGKVAVSHDPDCVRVILEQPELVNVVQQRAYVRTEARRPVEIDTNEGCLRTHTVDLSGGGMLLADHGSLLRNETAGFVLQAYPGSRPIVGTARTVRFDAEARPALEFVSISVADRWRLVRLTLDLERERLTPGATPVMHTAEAR